MSKKVIIAVFCIFGLVLCFGIEQSVHKKNTYAYYKENQQKREETKPVVQNMTLLEKVTEENKEKKVAYLTFDDGPSEVTEMVLKVLDEKRIKATFFLIGNEITKEREELVKRMVKEGHTIGVHTYCHKKDIIYRSSDAYVEDAMQTADRIYEVTGKTPTVYRFPWGSVNGYLENICDDTINKMEEKGYTYYDWNVSAEDSVGTPSEYSILHNIEKDFKKYTEPVILMHDSAINKLTAQTLPQIIEMLEKEGYVFDTLENRSEPCQYSRN